MASNEVRRMTLRLATKCYAMRGFSVGIKSNFLISFGHVGQFGDGRA